VCGRFNVASTPGLQELLGALGADLQLLEPRFNVAPTEPVALLRDGSLVEARWWLTPHWAKQVEQKYAMFNARCEGLGKSTAFRRPFARQRGVVPMSGFIEWQGAAGNRQPWHISNASQAIAVAALWDLWRGADEILLSCTLVTTEAAPELRPWHNRMPVMLVPGECPRWLDNTKAVHDEDPLFAPVLKEALYLAPVDRAVGNSRNKEPALMASTGETVLIGPASSA
jgi:putative SOS response-associated peptidase YedK